MKKQVFLAFCVLLFARTNSQISLEQTYPATAQITGLDLVNLSLSGHKYSYISNNTLKLYNLNHSLWKTISLNVPSNLSLRTVAFVSETFFDNDPGIELAYTFHSGSFFSPSSPYTVHTKIINEDGSLLLDIPNGYYLSARFAGNSGWKLIATIDSANKLSVQQYNVYSLPGFLPTSNKTAEKEDAAISLISGPVPNPSSGKTSISYQLPEGEESAELVIFDINGKEVRTYTVDTTFNTLELDNSELGAGTYFYQLRSAGTISEAKKMLIIK
jgi:hypothetical protein